MKKKILSFLLCLCMVAVLLPTTALAAPADTPVENVTFNYAYDVQRTPAFPSKVGDNITLWDLAAPKNSNGNTDGMQNNGSWTLTRVGTYSYVKGNVNDDKLKYLESIVTRVATEYRISDKKDTIVIHELKNGKNHIAYGVVIAYSATEEMAVFVGDSLSGSGAGYLLSTGSRNDSVTVTAGMIATDFANQTDSIVLAPAKPTFPAVPEGYDTAPSLEITVKNIGNVDTGLLNITLSGNNAACFTVTPGTIGNIGADSDSNVASFQVKPNAGLPAGTYTATVTVSGTGTNVDAQKIEVSFTVNPASQSTPVVIIVPDDTTNTADPAKNPETGDNSTHLLWAVMASSALCAAALLFSSRRRGEEMQ